MTLKLNSNAVMLCAVVAMSGSLYDKFYLQAKKVRPSTPDAIIYTTESPQYKPSYHLDANFDGFITQGEINIANAYTPTTKGFEFVENLSPLDRRLAFGLSVNVAKIAVSELTTEEKQALVLLSNNDRIRLINQYVAGNREAA